MISRIFAVLIALLALLALPLPLSAQTLPDNHPCFSDNPSQRIRGCTELIEAPGTDLTTRAHALAMRALGYSLQAEYEIAIRDYDAAIRIIPDFAVALNNRAWAKFKWGKSPEGLPDVEKSLRLDPFSPHSFDTRAHIRQAMGDPDGAFADYEKTMVLGGSRFIKLYQCGLAMAKLYSGPTDGIYSSELRQALKLCVQSPTCDPLPPDEDCRPTTS